MSYTGFLCRHTFGTDTNMNGIVSICFVYCLGVVTILRCGGPCGQNDQIKELANNLQACKGRFNFLTKGS